jgi:tetratricopeptide (TPR) repeat protein
MDDQVPDDLAERIEYLEGVVRIAYDGLGGDAFVEENRREFWGLLETRPYMRARAFLAMDYHEAGRLPEAIAEFEALLDLNPDDHQGMRHWLLGAYLEHGDFAGARALIKEYGESAAATFAWGHLLERFVTGDLDGAGRALVTARQVNPYVEAYASGQRRLPEEHPGIYGHGDEREAEFCCFVLGPAWRDNPTFLHWLVDQQQGTTYFAVEKVGRNDPCPCGSGKKYKKCCGQ